MRTYAKLSNTEPPSIAVGAPALGRAPFAIPSAPEKFELLLPEPRDAGEAFRNRPEQRADDAADQACI
jgi:hypothetical protein